MNAAKKYCANCFVVMDGGISYCPRCTYPQPMTVNPAYLHPPFRLHQQYVIGRVLGHGGFGITYLAYDRSLGVKVAIKEYFPSEYAARDPRTMNVVPHPGKQREMFMNGKEKFIAEARLLSSLRSPYTIRIRHFFEECDTAYFVMEYLEGQNLKDYLKGKGMLSFTQTRPILTAILDALEEVHSHSTYHRDIKPDNVYMTLQGHPILLDFGSARQLSGVTQNTMGVLTPGFAAIEQYSTHGVQGPWTDIYGVAATLYYTLTGKAPVFPQDRLTGDRELIPPSEHGADLRSQEESWLLKGLEIRWNDRPSSVAEWRRTLPLPPQAEFDQEQAVNSAEENFIRFAILPKLANRFLMPQAEQEILEAGDFLNISRGQSKQLIEVALERTGSVRRAPDRDQGFSSSDTSRLTFSEIFQPVHAKAVSGPALSSFTNSLGMEFVPIDPLTEKAGVRIPKPFLMGRQGKAFSVSLSKPYQLQKHLVTQAQWQKIMGESPSRFHGSDRLPVEQISWEDTQQFIYRLNQKGEGTYRLPTEAEWEYACRGGAENSLYFGNDLSLVDRHAWHQANSQGHVNEVGKRLPNPYGLCDMLGNLWEWVQDWDGAPPEGHVSDPSGPKLGNMRVLRGGCWNTPAPELALCRWQRPSYVCSWEIGLRLVREL